jgi:predicted DNA-binding transcriptional regulator YafY
MPPRRQPPRRSKKPKPLLTPSQRRDELRLLLRSGWQSAQSLVERLGVERTTVWRRLRELEATGEPLEQHNEDGRTLWRLPAGPREHPLHITTAEMIALKFVNNALGFVAGTGIKEDIDTLVARFSHVLKASDYAHWKNLDRKLFDLNEGAWAHGEEALDVVNDVFTALLHQHCVTLTRTKGEPVKVLPYTLALYKKGLYLLGFSHAHGAVRTYGLDIVTDVERHPGEPFDYPADFDPAAHLAGPFGMIRGPQERVVVRFDPSMRRVVTRRRWHPTQRFRDVDGKVEMTLDPHGWEEMVSWVLGFGEKAEVVEPRAMRERVAKAARGMAGIYGAGGS